MCRYEVLLRHVPITVCNLCIASCKLIGMNPGNINTFMANVIKIMLLKKFPNFERKLEI